MYRFRSPLIRKVGEFSDGLLGMHDFGRVRGQRLSLVAIFRGDRLENALKLSEGQFSRRHQPIASAERRYLRYPAVRPIAVQYNLIIVDVHVLPL